MKSAKLLYKCRQCGEIFTSGLHAPDGHTVLMCNIVNKELPDEWGPLGIGYQLDIHHCLDRIHAVADFVGVKYD